MGSNDTTKIRCLILAETRNAALIKPIVEHHEYKEDWVPLSQVDKIERHPNKICYVYVKTWVARGRGWV